jgi:hypothetical protein
VRLDQSQSVEHQLDAPGDQVCQGGRGAAVGHVDQLQAGTHREQLTDQMGDASGAARPETYLAGSGLCICHEFPKVADG